MGITDKKNKISTIAKKYVKSELGTFIENRLKLSEKIERIGLFSKNGDIVASITYDSRYESYYKLIIFDHSFDVVKPLFNVSNTDLQKIIQESSIELVPSYKIDIVVLL